MLMITGVGAAVPVAAFLYGVPSLAQPAPANGDPAALIQQADALAAAGKYQQAAVAYTNAAKVFEAQGRNKEAADAYGRSATMYEKWADQLKGGAPPAPPAAPVTPPTPPPPPTPAVTPGAPAAPAPPNPAVPAGATPLPLDASAIVNRNAQGALAVAGRDGRPVEGLKLSRHDSRIYSPSIAVGPDGTIHVAFVEAHATTNELAVYHRSSSDGGRTWSDAKNLSEVMPGYVVGNCKVVIDGSGRVYVIWRTGVAEGLAADMDPHAGPTNNLWYRVLGAGRWSGKALPVHPPYTNADWGRAAASWFASVDPVGKVHVIWNMPPTQLMKPGDILPGLGVGRVMEAVLNGQAASAPREIYMTKVAPDPNYPGPGCAGLDTINGYVDAAGQAHFVAKVEFHGSVPNGFQLIEHGTQTPVLELPGPVYETWQYPPTLLFDARGQRHIIVMYRAGEQPNVRDYLVGSNDEPTVIRAAKEVKGSLSGFQAYQGPGGRMIVIMQMNDTGDSTANELYLSTSDGEKWSPPVNVTNNTGRQTFVSTQTSTASHVASYSNWYPGPAAATYDRQGHLVLAYVSIKRSVVESVAMGWTLAGGSTSTPNLLFLRF